MDEAMEDEKKPFDAEGPGHEDDVQPDPDETLMLNQGSGRVWLVKIPKFLLERWSSINDDEVHLATIRVYNDPTTPGKRPRIILFLPPYRPSNSSLAPPHNPLRPMFPEKSSRPASDAEPDQYELEMINDNVENQVVVAERPKDASFGLSSSVMPLNASASSRARTTILTGRVKHDCNLRPAFSERYRRQMRERHLKYNTPQRQIMMIEDAGVSGGRGGINRLSSGVGVGAGAAFGDLIKTKPKPAKGQFERMARIPRNQLLDLIFQLFRDTPRWGIKPLREKTQQPEVYLKETLSDVAFLHRSGEFNGLWELKDSFKSDGAKSEGMAGSYSMGMGINMHTDVKMEEYGGGDDDDDDDDEDEDMEEVS